MTSLDEKTRLVALSCSSWFYLLRIARRSFMKAIISLVLAVQILSLAEIVDCLAQSTDRTKLIEDAKKEGKLMVYVSSNASDAKALKAAFEKKYPCCTKVIMSGVNGNVIM